jgi:hypothetical protein
MLRKDRIDFIDIEDEAERINILQRYVRSKTLIQKSEYGQAMKNSALLREFNNEISISCHNWTRLILLPFLKELPLESKQKEEELEQLEQMVKRMREEETETLARID